LYDGVLGTHTTSFAWSHDTRVVLYRLVNAAGLHGSSRSPSGDGRDPATPISPIETEMGGPVAGLDQLRSVLTATNRLASAAAASWIGYNAVITEAIERRFGKGALENLDRVAYQVFQERRERGELPGQIAANRGRVIPLPRGAQVR
jgi:hypothetical protein